MGRLIKRHGTGIGPCSLKAVAFLGATVKDKYPVQTGQGCCGDQPGAGMSRRHIPERSPSPSTLRVFSHHLIFESSASFFFSPSCSAPAVSQLSGLGGGGWPEPLRLSLYLNPATSWVWCMSRWPLPSTCSGCALVGVGGRARKIWPVSPQACPACPTAQSLLQARGLGGKAP